MLLLAGWSPHGTPGPPQEEEEEQVVPREVSSVSSTRGSIVTAALSCVGGCSTASLLAPVSADASRSACMAQTGERRDPHVTAWLAKGCMCV